LTLEESCGCSPEQALKRAKNTYNGDDAVAELKAHCLTNKEKYAKWVVYCDVNNNGEFDKDEKEKSTDFLLYKAKCDKQKTPVEIECGKPEDNTKPPTTEKPITEPVTEEPEPQCDCEVPAKILKKLGTGGSAKCLGHKKKIEMQFFCDLDKNGEVDEGEELGIVEEKKCVKFNKTHKKMKWQKKCNKMKDKDEEPVDECGCETQIAKVEKKLKAEAECVKANAKKPTWKFTCKNGESEEFTKGCGFFMKAAKEWNCGD